MQSSTICPKDLRKEGTPMTRRVDVGILTIRDDEFRAVLNAFPQKATPPLITLRRHYNLRMADAGQGGQYQVAILRQVEQGTGEALSAARDLLEELSPRLLLVVGIAGGVPHSDFTLGDVVLSTRVHDYSVEARKENETPTYAMSGGPIDLALGAAVANLAARADDLGDWAPTAERPQIAEGLVNASQLYGPADWQDKVRKSLRSQFGRGPRSPSYIAGVIASSDRLVKDTQVLIPWLQTSRQILAIEMESGGVYRAGQGRAATLAIRGISDIVGLLRDEEWTRYACLSAASFARAFLKTTPIPLGGEEPPPIDERRTRPVRLMMQAVLRIDSDFEAFVLDFFPRTSNRFGAGMTRDAKETLLLKSEDLDEIIKSLREHDPVRFKKNEGLLSTSPKP
jgi:nucleoside phosphorylase